MQPNFPTGARARCGAEHVIAGRRSRVNHHMPAPSYSTGSWAATAALYRVKADNTTLRRSRAPYPRQLIGALGSNSLRKPSARPLRPSATIALLVVSAVPFSVGVRSRRIAAGDAGRSVLRRGVRPRAAGLRPDRQWVGGFLTVGRRAPPLVSLAIVSYHRSARPSPLHPSRTTDAAGSPYSRRSLGRRLPSREPHNRRPCSSASSPPSTSVSPTVARPRSTGLRRHRVPGRSDRGLDAGKRRSSCMPLGTSPATRRPLAVHAQLRSLPSFLQRL